MNRLRPVLIVSVISIALALATLEIGLRVLGIGSDALMRSDPWTGWSHIPGRHGSVESEDRSLGRQMAITIDSLGLRDIERTPAKAPGTYRVALIGDSFVEAQQVPLDSCLSRRLERALDGVAGRHVEVWNCGVSGYTTSQEWMYLRHTVAAWHPDLVALGFLVGNDVADAVPEKATSLRNRPFFRLAGDSLVFDRSFFRSDTPGIGWLRLHSRLFNWANGLRQAARIGGQRRAAAADTGGHVPDDLQIYAVQPDSIWSRAWRIIEREIVGTRDDARAIGADFVLAAFSGGDQETPKAREHSPSWSRWKDRPEVSLEEPEHRLARLAAAETLEFVPLLPAFRAAQARDGIPRHIAWVGHWNSAGHALAAQVLAPVIAAKIRPAR